MRILTHAGERRRYRIAVGEAGDAVVILAVGERQLVAGCIANENHLAFRVAHILEYIAARIMQGNRVGAVCGHDNILCNRAGLSISAATVVEKSVPRIRKLSVPVGIVEVADAELILALMCSVRSN